MDRQYEYDLLVIGCGPGGYVAAIRAAQLGLKTAVFEKDKPGGVCLNVGCIPSKSLIHQAGVFASIKELEAMGVQVDPKSLNYQKVYEKSRLAAQTLSKGVKFLLKKNKIDLIEAEAMITGPHEVTANGNKKISGKNILIATGSRPREIPGFVFDESTLLSSTGALMLETLPNKMLILGGGAIGVEFAYILNAFGVDVTVVELLDRILPIEDYEIVEVAAKAYAKKGIQIKTGTKAIKMDKTDMGVTVVLEDKEGKQETMTVDKVLVAVGRAPNTTGFGLENIGIETEKGYIPVGDYYETKIPGIYAVGDVINSPLLAHVASKEGEIAVEHMAGLSSVHSRLDPLAIPGAVYCEPQVASFGYTEDKAKDEGIPFKKAVFPYRGAGKSVAVERPEGLVKVLYDPDTKEILGCHCVGADATELIHELLLAKSAELLPEDVATMIHAHPTLSEAVMEAMRMVEGWAIHI